ACRPRRGKQAEDQLGTVPGFAQIEMQHALGRRNRALELHSSCRQGFRVRCKQSRRARCGGYRQYSPDQAAAEIRRPGVRIAGVGSNKFMRVSPLLPAPPGAATKGLGAAQQGLGCEMTLSTDGVEKRLNFGVGDPCTWLAQVKEQGPVLVDPEFA